MCHYLCISHMWAFWLKWLDPNWPLEILSQGGTLLQFDCVLDGSDPSVREEALPLIWMRMLMQARLSSRAIRP